MTLAWAGTQSSLQPSPCRCVSKGEVLPIRSYTTADGLASGHVDPSSPILAGSSGSARLKDSTRFDGYPMAGFGPADRAFLETCSGVLRRHGTRP